jgi:hypothetical protein
MESVFPEKFLNLLFTPSQLIGTVTLPYLLSSLEGGSASFSKADRFTWAHDPILLYLLLNFNPSVIPSLLIFYLSTV